MKLITGPASDAKCTIIFINQIRKTIAMYGPTETTTGGKALKFYATQRLEIKNRGQVKEGDDVIGFKQQIKVVKNKVAAPFQVYAEDIIYGKGVDNTRDSLKLWYLKESWRRKLHGTNTMEAI